MTVDSSFGPPPLPTASEPESVIVASPKLAAEGGKVAPFDSPDGPSFSDLLDVLNPLQHIPVINTIYQELTGDKEGAVADLVGGALWGGIIGLGAAVVNLIVEDNTGKSIGGNVVALFRDDDSDTAVAKNDQPAEQAGSAQATDQSKATAPAIPITLTALEQSTPAPAGGGPIMLGNFLVFGGQQAPAKARQDSAAAGSSATADKGAAMSDQASPEMADAGPVRSGGFLIFGAGQPAADDLPAAAGTPIALTPPSGDSAKAPVTQAAPSSAPPARSFPIPTQRNTVTPPTVLPMPTTGPAAVPGNARAASAARGGPDQTGSTWFAGAFNQAMDKYNRAALLGTDSAAATQGASGGATANSVLQMN